jgi:hypothetical protein
MGHVLFHHNIVRHQRGAHGLWRPRLLSAHILAGLLPHLQQLGPHDQGAAQAQLTHSLEAHHNHFRPCPAGKHKRWCWVVSAFCSAPEEVTARRAKNNATGRATASTCGGQAQSRPKHGFAYYTHPFPD